MLVVPHLTIIVPHALAGHTTCSATASVSKGDSSMNVDARRLRDGLVEAIVTMEAASDHLGCAYVTIAIDDRYRYAIVCGWDDVNGTDELHAKVAMQSLSSIMQCDYWVDWDMPYDRDTGEVWDTDIVIDSGDAYDIDWLVDQAALLAAFDFDVTSYNGAVVLLGN